MSIKAANEVIIVKKHRGGHHDDHHGGGWKVAFADFALAMMAFFLVLWLVAATNSEQKREIAQYINTATILEDNELVTSLSPKQSLIDMEGSLGALDGKGSSVLHQSPSGDLIFASPTPHKKIARTPEELAKLAIDISEKLTATSPNADSLGQVVDLKIHRHGLRIILSDDESHNMFNSGSSQLNPYFVEILESLAPILNETQNDLFISGHTDAITFANDRAKRSNWELSAERAISARQALARGGMDIDNMLLVAGMGAQVHRIPEEPNSRLNRRIELYLLTPDAAEMIRSLYSQSGGKLQDRRKQEALDRIEEFENIDHGIGLLENGVGIPN